MTAYSIGGDIYSPGEFWDQLVKPQILATDPLWPLPGSWLTDSWLNREGNAESCFLQGSLGRLVTASYLAAFVSGLSRIYLYLRWDLDKEPPSSLIQANETFDWS